jgi:hypothetical protein
MNRLMAALAVTMAMTATGQDPVGKAVTGSWKSAGAEDLGNGSFATREFTLTDKTWSLVFTIHGDKELKQPLVALGFSGPWKATGASKQAPGASEATFEFEKKTITLKAKDPAVAKGFGMDGCGLEAGKSKDVSKSGCSFVSPVEKYGREFDLIKREGDKVFFGARPADGNMGSEDKRPTALGAPLVRAK